MQFLNSFDPNLLDIGGSFLAVAAKYAGFFGICGYVLKALVKAFSGKENFL